MNVNLKAERLNRGLGITDAANRIGIHVSILQRAEEGINTPHPKNAFKIASFYGFKVTDIWPLPDEDESPEPQAVGS